MRAAVDALCNQLLASDPYRQHVIPVASAKSQKPSGDGKEGQTLPGLTLPYGTDPHLGRKRSKCLLQA